MARLRPDGRFSGVESHADEQALSHLIDELQRRGQGYMEIRRAGVEWPLLAVGIAAHHAVIHLFDSAESVALLHGEGSGEAVEVPIMDTPTTFDGTFALSLENARRVLLGFARGNLPTDLIWHRL